MVEAGIIAGGWSSDHVKFPHFVDLLGAYARLGMHASPSLVHALEDSVMSRWDGGPKGGCDFTTVTVNFAFWAYSKLGLRPNSAIAARMEKVVFSKGVKTGEFKLLAGIVGAYARWGRVLSEDKRAFLEGQTGECAAQKGRRRGMLAEEVGSILWGYATMRARPGAKVMRRIEDVIMEREEGKNGIVRHVNQAGTEVSTCSDCLKTSHLGIFLWSYGAMRLQPGEGVVMKLEELAMSFEAGDFTTMCVVGMLCGYAMLSLVPGDDLKRRLLAEMVSVAAEFSPEQLSDSLWALATMRIHPGERDRSNQIKSNEIKSGSVGRLLVVRLMLSSSPGRKSREYPDP